MVESSTIAVYSVPCGLTWATDVALFVGEADMEALVLGEVTDRATGERLRLLENTPLNSGRSSRDFFDCFPGGGTDMSTFRYYVVRWR